MGRPVEDTNRPLKVEFAYLKQLPANTPVPATGSRWASVRTGGMSAKNGPASRHPITPRTRPQRDQTLLGEGTRRRR